MKQEFSSVFKGITKDTNNISYTFNCGLEGEAHLARNFNFLLCSIHIHPPWSEHKDEARSILNFTYNVPKLRYRHPHSNKKTFTTGYKITQA